MRNFVRMNKTFEWKQKYSNQIDLDARKRKTELLFVI